MSVELERESSAWLQGVSDLHIYCTPCVYARQFDEIDMAKQCRDVGYKAILSKRHHCINADAAQLATKAVPGMRVFGGVVLNWDVGGLNPIAVDSAIMLGAKEVWMPNRHAGKGSTKPIKGDIYRHNVPPRFKERPSLYTKEYPPINILTPDGRIQSSLYEIFGLVADANIILGTGHISRQEAMALIEVARKSNVRKMVVTHPDPLPDSEFYWPIEDLMRVADMGAICEFNSLRCQGWARQWAEAIRKVGPSRCVMASGLGAWGWIHPIEGMRNFIRQMRLQGLTEKEIDMMTKEIPAKLLDID